MNGDVDCLVARIPARPDVPWVRVKTCLSGVPEKMHGAELA